MRKLLSTGMFVKQSCILVSKLTKKDNVSTVYCSPKLHKKPYKACFIANSSSCMTTELSKMLASCLTAVKNKLLSTAKRYMKDLVRIYFGLLRTYATKYFPY